MKYYKSFLLLNILLLTLVTQSYALILTPGNAWLTGSDGPADGSWETNSQSVLDDILLGLSIGSELYKSEVDDSKEFGLLAGSYTTTYTNTPTDPENALIVYVAGTSWIEDAYLVVKDGDHSPWWYLFDLTDTDLDWNGTEDLVLSGFWAVTADNPQGQGAISHVSIHGLNPVPEPATMFLFGLGLLGLAGVSRKKK